MSKEYGTIKIPHDAYQRHNQQRKDFGLTWEEYINGESPNHVDVDELINLIDTANEPDDTLQVSELLEELRKTKELIDQMPERTASEVEDRFK